MLKNIIKWNQMKFKLILFFPLSTYVSQSIYQKYVKMTIQKYTVNVN